MELNKSQYIKIVFYTFIVLMIIYGILRVNIDTFRRLRDEAAARDAVVYVDDEDAYDAVEQNFDYAEQNDIEQTEIDYAN